MNIRYLMWWDAHPWAYMIVPVVLAAMLVDRWISTRNARKDARSPFRAGTIVEVTDEFARQACHAPFGLVTSVDANGQPYVRFRDGGLSYRFDPADISVVRR